MSKLLFANNATSTLASNLSSGTTAIPLATGTGALYPSPAAGEYFVISLFSQTNPAITEICWCTARTGDSLTVVRAREGTSALTWSVGDIVNLDWTAGQAGAMLQSGADAAAGTVFSNLTGGPAPPAFNTLAALGAALVTFQSASEFNIGPIYFKFGTTPSMNVNTSYGVVFTNPFPTTCFGAYPVPRVAGAYTVGSDSWVVLDQSVATTSGFTVWCASASNNQAMYADWWAWGE